MTHSSIEERLGLSEWPVSAEGVGGLLKCRVEDFRVEEASPSPTFQLAQRDLESVGISGLVTYCAVESFGCHNHTASTGVSLAKSEMLACMVSMCR